MKERSIVNLVAEENAKAWSESLIAAIGDGISVQDTNLTILYQNQIHKDNFGDHLGEYCYQSYAKKENICASCPVVQSQQDGQLHRMVRSNQFPEGIKHFEITTSPLKDTTGRIVAGVEVIREITERVQAEEALQESERKFRSLAEHSLVGITIVQDGEFKYVNPKFAAMFGYTREECLNSELFQKTIHTADREIVQEQVRKRELNGQQTVHYEARGIKKNDEVIYLDVYGSAIQFNNRPASIGSLLDITEHKLREIKLSESERKYRNLVENAVEGIAQVTGEGYWITVNQAFADMLGYGAPEELITATDDISKVYTNPRDGLKLKKIADAEGVAKGFEAALRKKDGQRITVQISAQAIRDNNGQLLYYQGICEDITSRKQMEKERLEAMEGLRKALGATIQALASAAEAKDPYTAGHQRRVADLARSIGTEMELSDEQIDGARMAGMIHDIGKMSVPAEILSKPTKLSAIEFSLIKCHSQSGYDILKDVLFPMPVARMVLEHHERIDGSGYPNGLRGDELLIESRIIAVADVVEAIASHRPYRPGFGIDAALDEISRGKGIIYDAEAVDACLRLFREKGYQLIS